MPRLADPAVRSPWPDVGLAAVLCLVYIGLYYLTEAAMGNEVVGGVASLFFPAAFVRLFGFLVVGFWIVPALLLAAMACIDLGLPLESRMVVAAFLAVGGPLGTWVTAQLCRLDLNLANLTPQRLLVLSIGCSLGNAVFYHLGLVSVGFPDHGVTTHLATFVGDTFGTWAIIYLIKTGLTLYGRSIRR